MARQKNASFVGVAVADDDVGAATLERNLADTVGDTALIFDKLTGFNSEPGIIVHDGGDGTGAPLHFVLVNQFINASIAVSSSAAKGSDGGPGITRLLCYPLHLSPGETQIYVELAAHIAIPNSQFSPFIQVCSTAVVEQANVPLTGADQAGENGSTEGTLLVARVDGLSPGDHLLFVCLDTTAIAADEAEAITSMYVSYVRVRVFHDLAHRVGSPYETNDGAQHVVPYTPGTNAFGVTLPAAGVTVQQRDFEATLFANLEPIDGYVLAGLNRNLNGLMEYITGFPAGGNGSFSQADTDGAGSPVDVNPAWPRFECHALEIDSAGEVDLPIWCEAFGAFMQSGKFAVELAEPPTKGTLSWYAPWPITTSIQEMVSAYIAMPDFQTGNSRLKCMVLLGSSSASGVGSWTVTVTTPAGSASATPVDCDGTTHHLWLATVAAIPFNPDVENKVDIKLARSGSKGGIGEICLLGVHLYFDP